MIKNSPLQRYQLLLLISLSYFPFPGISQAIIIGGSLYGEPVVSSFNTHLENSGGETAVQVVSTGTSIYLNENLFPLGSVYNRIFTIPPGRTVKDVGTKRKKIVLPDKTKTVASYVVILLDNGQVYGYDFSNGDTRYWGKVGSAGSESWFKILGDALFALSSSYLYVSRDQGATWQQNITGIGGAKIWDFDQDTSLATLYAATSNGLYKQDTLPGATWSKVLSFTGTTNLYRVFCDQKGRILLGGNGGGLWISTDDGATWNVDTAGLGPNGTLDVFGDDLYGNLYGANSGTRRLYRSLNGTQPWQRIDAGLTAITVNTPQIIELSGDTFLSAATSYGVFMSTDQGITWHKNDSGIVTTTYYGLAKLNNGKLYASNSLGIFQKSPAGETWTRSYPMQGFSGAVPVYADINNNLYGLDNNITHANNKPIPIVKSIDQGQSWTLDTAGLSAIDGNLFYIDEMGVQHYCNTFFGSSFPCRLWKRNPPGGWQIDTAGFPALNNSFISSFASDRNGYLYVSGSFSGKKLMRRPIMGTVWVLDTMGLSSSVTRFTKMTPGYHGDVVGTNGNLLLHRGNGIWSRINLPAALGFPSITAIATDSAGNIFTAFSNGNGLGRGVFYTKDFGTTWTLAGLDSVEVSQLIAYDDTVYALTAGYGAYILKAGSSSSSFDCRWLGAISTDWHNPANWNCGIVPTAEKSVMIPTGTPFNCEIINSDAVAERVWVQPGAFIYVKNNRKLLVSGTNTNPTW